MGRTDRRTLTLRIPAGTRDGTTVRVKRKGTPGVAGVRPAGDLHVLVRLRGTVEPSPVPPPGRPTTDVAAGGTAGPLQSEHVIVTANAPDSRSGNAAGWASGTLNSRCSGRSYDACPSIPRHTTG
ncbi:DnaJ C-terminal domain-containing protein [Streptomyces sp. NPDC090032]|uniref:DnaJ C-terminal domain-containing protein n=1 Tax=unclassified Streptomyces TaxID=2593676 RepID=UPI003716FB5F